MADLEALTKIYVCPKCKSQLALAGPDQLKCVACASLYQVKDGIPVFAPLLIDQFYEQRVWETDLELSPKAPWLDKFIVWFHLTFNINQRRKSFMKRMLKKKKGLLLDLGCGAGKQFYREVGPVIGIDICLSGLNKARRVYHAVAQADALALPFADGLFDFIVSNDLIEHIPEPQKDQLFQEMWRVLKPGGQLVHEIETLSDNFWYRLGLKDLDLFFKYFVVEISGHFGLEPPAAVLERFRKLGAKQVRVESIFDLILPLQDWLRLFGQGYRQKYFGLRVLAGMIEFCQNNRSVKLMIDILLGLKAMVLAPFRGLKHSKDLGVVFEKPL